MQRRAGNRLRLPKTVQLPAAAPALRRAVRLHAFAARLIARHARGVARWRWLDLMLATSPASFVNNLSRHYVLSLASVAGSRPARALASQSVIEREREVGSAIAPAAGGAVLMPLADARSTRPAMQTLSRLIERRERIETVAKNVYVTRDGKVASRGDDASESRSFASVSRSGAELPLAKLSARSATAAPEKSAAMRAAAELKSVTSSRSDAPAVSERELDRLTERVIGSIDRRIIAQRERLGRA